MVNWDTAPDALSMGLGLRARLRAIAYALERVQECIAAELL
ncbi:MAG: hypothetical protein ACYCZN_01695 [Candidatus Dormibacteria bacterium]